MCHIWEIPIDKIKICWSKGRTLLVQAIKTVLANKQHQWHQWCLLLLLLEIERPEFPVGAPCFVTWLVFRQMHVKCKYLKKRVDPVCVWRSLWSWLIHKLDTTWPDIYMEPTRHKFPKVISILTHARLPAARQTIQDQDHPRHGDLGWGRCQQSRSCWQFLRIKRDFEATSR